MQLEWAAGVGGGGVVVREGSPSEGIFRLKILRFCQVKGGEWRESISS